ncbi:hypothetical protein V1477_016324 [Vespula maculifrons]|uniref:Uncharacterized protein n=1 Tax=Vespula maculifrons TaxID=7453 RepID=A0ABD2BCP0_VESMC
MVLLVVVGWLVSSGSDADTQRVVSKGGSMGLFEDSVCRMECSDEKENEKVRTGGSGDGGGGGDGSRGWESIEKLPNYTRIWRRKRGSTRGGARDGLASILEKLLQTESNLSLALCAVLMVGKLVGRCARSLLELQGAVFADLSRLVTITSLYNFTY